MLVQSTLILYHTEANGCIFFAMGVLHQDKISDKTQLKQKKVKDNYITASINSFPSVNEDENNWSFL